jgi:peptidoglycan/LPS O-acetylase OafA/YrhL
MVGVFRLILSLIVVQAHLLAAGWPWLAWQAVFAFYVLSGFLMTLVLTETYQRSLHGFTAFWVNRTLRLYPGYLIVISLVVIVAAMGLVTSPIPSHPAAWIKNIAIFGLSGFTDEQLEPERLFRNSWSLAIEVSCYLVLSAYFAFSQKRLATLLVIGIAVAIATIVANSSSYDWQQDFFDRYTTIQAGFIPFALGGLAYYHRHALAEFLSGRFIFVVAAVFLVNTALSFNVRYAYTIGLYLSVFVTAAVVPFLFVKDEAKKPSYWMIVCGGLAYPVFITHWFVGHIVSGLLPALTYRGAAHFTFSLIATLALSAALYFWCDRPIEKLRSNVKALQ